MVKVRKILMIGFCLQLNKIKIIFLKTDVICTKKRIFALSKKIMQ
jgi:hypothetical protein